MSAVLTAFLVAAGTAGSAVDQPKDHAESNPGFQEFLRKVEDYVRLRKAAEASLPKLKTTDLPELIAAHQQALARKLREARPHARRSDIFTQRSCEAFLRAIQSEFSGPHAAYARATIQQGSPLKQESHLKVNEVYPAAVPYTTVPPTLLLKLPKLPDQVEYRIVDRDLVLLDIKANLVVDLIVEAMPPGFSGRQP